MYYARQSSQLINTISETLQKQSCRKHIVTESQLKMYNIHVQIINNQGFCTLHFAYIVQLTHYKELMVQYICTCKCKAW